MTFAAADWVAVADDLVARAGVPLPEEAALRAAIGRYYYACLVTVASRVVTAATPVERDTTHAQVLRALRDRDDPSAQLVQADLSMLRVERNRAEYGEPLSGDLRTLAGRTRALATRVLKRAASL
jgi:hypothetical protein